MSTTNSINLPLMLLFCLLGSICSAGLSGLLLVLKKDRLTLLTHTLIPYAIGSLLGAAFLGMIPHALEKIPNNRVGLTVLIGIVIFFLLEKFTLWRHCHEHSCERHNPAGDLILIGDSLHNFVDGVAIAVAFAGSTSLGITTSLAVIAHEIPQEVGDYAILMQSGYTRSRALLLNILSSAATLPGALLTYFLLPFAAQLVPYLLSIGSASFIYIALADLLPGHRKPNGTLGAALRELVLMALGVITIVALQAQHK